jgi:GntR family transcriptional regulator, transcriptional repressor for pyruvate dehydrogenase complex
MSANNAPMKNISMKKVIPEPIKPRRLSEIVETHIRDFILDGKIALGEQLPTEKELSTQFGVSTVTAREALKGLEALGLIEKRKGRSGGIFVTQTKIDSVKVPLYSFLQGRNCSSAHLTELRMIMEPAAVRIAASHITQRAIKDLEENIEACEAEINKVGRSLSEGQFFSIEQGNIEFHRLIAEATNNPVLALTIDYVMDLLFNVKRRTLTPNIEVTIGTTKDHRSILAYLKKGDPEGAEKAMVLHLARLEQYLKKGSKKTERNLKCKSFVLQANKDKEA